ncbi:hypothetical protein GGH92_009801, partial [Coemansia sp. RSA 2673]
MSVVMQHSTTWVRRLRQRIMRPKKASTPEHSRHDELVLSACSSLCEVRVVHVGKDTRAGSSIDEPLYSAAKVDDADEYLPEGMVAFLDDCDEEQIAAHLLRQQSLLRRNLHRMGLILARKPTKRLSDALDPSCF